MSLHAGVAHAPSPARMPTAVPSPDLVTQLRLAVARAYWAVPPGPIRTFLDTEVTSDVSPAELRTLVRSSATHISLRDVIPSKDATISSSLLRAISEASSSFTP